MVRTPDKRETHTTESILHVADELERLASKLKTAVTLLKADHEPPIPSIGVRYEPALVGGLASLRTWANEVQDCASDARRERAKNVSVRRNGHVPDAPKKGSKKPAEMKPNDDD